MNSNETTGEVLLSIRKDSIAKVLEIDDRILTRADFLEVKPPLNPHQFDYKSYLARQGIHQQVFLKSNEFLQLAPKTTFLGWISQLRSNIQQSLKKEGFGVLTEIDMKGTLKKKLDIDFQNYTILGACNPSLAFKALRTEDKIGTMLPCNVIVQEKEPGTIEVAAVDPAASMQAVNNDDLISVAYTVRERLKRVIKEIDG